MAWSGSGLIRASLTEGAGVTGAFPKCIEDEQESKQSNTGASSPHRLEPDLGAGGPAGARLQEVFNVRLRNYQGSEMIKQVFQEDKSEENVQDELENLEAWQQLDSSEIN